MAIRFLLDENLRGVVWKAIERHNLTSSFPLDVVRVGDRDELPLGLSDADILEWSARANRILISDDRKTMRQHLDRFVKAHGQSPGVLLLRPHMTVSDVLEYLVLIAYASEPDEWVNRGCYIPPV